jgi:hypothetical protein
VRFFSGARIAAEPGNSFEHSELGQGSVSEVALYFAGGHGSLTLPKTLRIRLRGAYALPKQSGLYPDGQRPLIRFFSDTLPVWAKVSLTTH